MKNIIRTIFILIVTISITPTDSHAQLGKLIRDAQKTVKDVKSTTKDIKNTKSEADDLLSGNKNTKNSKTSTKEVQSGYTQISIQNVDFVSLSELVDFLEQLSYVKKVSSTFNNNTAVFSVDCRESTRVLVADLLKKSGYVMTVLNFDANAAELKKE